MQTRWQSFKESIINVSIGYIVAIISQLLIFPLFDIHIPFTDNLLIGLYFTIIGIARSYIVRRYFNNQTHVPVLPSQRDTPEIHSSF